MKSVLVIDTPPCCEDCPCSTVVKAPQIGCWSANCEVCGKFNDLIMTKPEWCPLKTMPNRIVYKVPETIEDYKVGKQLEMAYGDGWNACIDELKGETE